MMTDFFNWNDEVTTDGSEFLTLPPGKYTGKISKIEKKKWEGSGKMNGCNVAEITVEVTTDDGEKAFVKDTLFLARSLEWKIAQFLRAFGLKEKGEPVKVHRIEKALNHPCMVTVRCKADKEHDYAYLDKKEAKSFLEDGLSVFNEIKEYAPLKEKAKEETEEFEESFDDEFGF